MNKEAWLKFVKTSREAHHIREIFNGTFQLINDPRVQDVFFGRIDRLTNEAREINDSQKIKDLENLREDIELEIDHGEMQKKELAKKGPGKIDKTPTTLSSFLRIIDSIRGDINELEEEIRKALREATGEEF
jgi:hypothetical protein